MHYRVVERVFHSGRKIYVPQMAFTSDGAFCDMTEKPDNGTEKCVSFDRPQLAIHFIKDRVVKRQTVVTELSPKRSD